MADEFVGKIYFERGTAIPAVSFDRVCEVFSISGVGETNELVETTTFCSSGFREYIAGLADGEEITLEANYKPGSDDLSNLIADVKAKVTRTYRLVIEQGSPETTMTFDAAPLSWVLNPSVDDRNTISYTLKISGEIEIAP